MSKSRRAFSLVELLVVIALIAVLIGSLLPVISRARASAAATACQNNLRSIAQACHTRATENDGYVGLAGIIDNGGRPHLGLPAQLLDSSRRRYQYLGYEDGLEDLKALPLVLAEHMSTRSRSGDHDEALKLSRGANENVLRVFQCPSKSTDEKRPRATHRLARGVVLVYSMTIDYAFNAGVFGFHHAVDSIGRRGRGKFPALDAARTVLACDMAVASPGAMAAFTPAVPGSSRATLADAMQGSTELVTGGARPDVDRHRSGANVVFADCHVEAVPADKLIDCILCR